MLLLAINDIDPTRRMLLQLIVTAAGTATTTTAPPASAPPSTQEKKSNNKRLNDEAHEASEQPSPSNKRQCNQKNNTTESTKNAMMTKQQIRNAFAVPECIVDIVEAAKTSYAKAMPTPLKPLFLNVECSRGIKENKKRTTVTELLARHFAFDNVAAIGNIRQCTRYSTDPTYEYYRLSPVEIEQRFFCAGFRGTQFHAWLEWMLLQHYEGENKVEKDTKEQNETSTSTLWCPFSSRLASRFVADVLHQSNLILLRTEWSVVDVEYGVVGRVDAVFVREDEWRAYLTHTATETERGRGGEATSTSQQQFPSLYLFDWKLSPNALAPINSIANDEKVVKTLAAPLNNIVDCTANKYALQLALYRHMMRRQGYRVARATVCRFNVDIAVEGDASYERVDVVDSESVESVVATLLKECLFKQ
jgi:hypothetical protein